MKSLACLSTSTGTIEKENTFQHVSFNSFVLKT
jgi:hypothetical protein